MVWWRSKRWKKRRRWRQCSSFLHHTDTLNILKVWDALQKATSSKNLIYSVSRRTLVANFILWIRYKIVLHCYCWTKKKQCLIWHSYGNWDNFNFTFIFLKKTTQESPQFPFLQFPTENQFLFLQFSTVGWKRMQVIRITKQTTGMNIYVVLCTRHGVFNRIALIFKKESLGDFVTISCDNQARNY